MITLPPEQILLVDLHNLQGLLPIEEFSSKISSELNKPVQKDVLNKK
jgi:hypothetical protein